MIFRLLLVLLCIVGTSEGRLLAADSVPPAPKQYVTDEAGVISAQELALLNERLAAFEKETSNQIVAVVYPKLPEGTSLEDYTQQLYQNWHIGQKKTSNGVLILVFVQNHKIRIQPGYGLEGAMPDALCSRIIRETMAPAFRAGNYGAGLDVGITAVMQATKGEYKGTGGKAHKSLTLLDLLFSPLGFFLLIFFVLMISNRGRGGGGGISPGAAAATGFFLGSSGGGWGNGGGGGGSGDGGGFSGGGGDSGGGGASGDW